MRLYDVHSRFARMHLRTPAERAVYFTLVAQLAESWSAAEIATLKDVDVRTVEAVLDGYADAGVVDGVDSNGGLRYRWRSDMSYLFNAGSSGITMIDPVCGMTTDGATPHRVSDGSGTLRLFCSSLCLAAFRADPPSYGRRQRRGDTKTRRQQGGSDSGAHRHPR